MLYSCIWYMYYIRYIYMCHTYLQRPLGDAEIPPGAVVLGPKAIEGLELHARTLRAPQRQPKTPKTPQKIARNQRNATDFGPFDLDSDPKTSTFRLETEAEAPWPALELLRPKLSAAQ